MWYEKIYMIEEQFNDMLEGLVAEGNYKISLIPAEEENSVGGNPRRLVYFSAVIKGMTYKDKEFTWQLSSQTENGFINTIKGYLFDVLDGVVNL